MRIEFTATQIKAARRFTNPTRIPGALLHRDQHGWRLVATDGTALVSLPLTVDSPDAGAAGDTLYGCDRLIVFDGKANLKAGETLVIEESDISTEPRAFVGSKGTAIAVRLVVVAFPDYRVIIPTTDADPALAMGIDATILADVAAALESKQVRVTRLSGGAGIFRVEPLSGGAGGAWGIVAGCRLD